MQLYVWAIMYLIMGVGLHKINIHYVPKNKRSSYVLDTLFWPIVLMLSAFNVF